jgi:hypothetical protein
MSMICYVVCILCSISAISAIRSPAVVYSAVIQNAQDGPIQCHVFWSKPIGDTLKSDVLTVKKTESYSTKEQKFDMGTWTARGVIAKISCGDLVVTAPFDQVKSPSTNWRFRVESNKIVSVGASA